MSEEQHHNPQEKIDSEEFSTLMAEIGSSHTDPKDKDRQRELLGAGYRNLNGDPMEEKVRLLARTDWTQIKFMLAEASRMNRVIRTLEEIKAKLESSASAAPAAPASFAARLFDFLTKAKTEIATVICFAIFFPNGAAVLKVLSSMVSGGQQP